MFYDPYNDEQIKCLRRDPTGRWSPIIEEEENEPDWIGYALGLAAGCGFALLILWGI